MDSSKESHDCCPEHVRETMGRHLCCIKESMKARKRKLRHYQEETNYKLENLEEFVYETIISQQDHEDMETVQQKRPITDFLGAFRAAFTIRNPSGYHGLRTMDS